MALREVLRTVFQKLLRKVQQPSNRKRSGSSAQTLGAATVSMDEQSGNLADESTEMMSESVAHQNEELRKRRSKRIMQAVPLAVTGVDALGRPFTERTSTLIINCHGCRYQSK